MKFSRQKLQRSGDAFRPSGRLTPIAYPNSQGSFERFLVAMVFSAMFQPLNVLDRDQLGFEFVPVFLARFGVGVAVVCFDVVAFDLFQDLVGAAGVFVLDVEDGVDEMLVLEQAEAVLPAKASKDRAVVESGLAIEIKLGGPPGGGAVFEFRPEGVEVIASALRAEG